MGLDVEFCRAVAAALFAGQSDKVEFVRISSSSSAAASAENDVAVMFSFLANGNVDLVAGSRVTLQAGHLEPATGVGYTFSRPYFYDHRHETGLGALALMTREEDPQWSNFVFWVVNALIFAEEHRITQVSPTKMPVVSLFGERWKQMFRDCVSVVGSYAEVFYNHTLEGTLYAASTGWRQRAKQRTICSPALFHFLCLKRGTNQVIF